MSFSSSGGCEMNDEVEGSARIKGCGLATEHKSIHQIVKASQNLIQALDPHFRTKRKTAKRG